MAETWRVRPPYPNWKDYGPSLAEYADDRIRAAQLPSGKTLAQWFRENEPLLRQEPCQRDKNTVVATALLPLFEKQPNNWEAVTWLNDGASHGSKVVRAVSWGLARSYPGKAPPVRAADRQGIRSGDRGRDRPSPSKPSDILGKKVNGRFRSRRGDEPWGG